MRLPTWLDPYLGAAKAIAVVAVALAVFMAGWKANGWRLGAQLAVAKAKRFDEIALQSRAAIEELASAAKKVNDAAAGAQVDINQMDMKLDAIRKEFKNAKPVPLPSDCRPDDPRVRQLTAVASAVDEAIARQRTSR